MADQSHLEILQQGVEAWNSWRKRNPSIEPDLSGADLPGADLSWADLSGADLSEADLSEANLSEADLSSGAFMPFVNLKGANLSRASLIGADLREASLYGANLYRAPLVNANLTAASLSRANLYDANLTKAELIRADLTEANLTEANLAEANLTEANLFGADLTHSSLVKTILKGATLTDCSIYGISAWSLQLEGATQHNLNVSDSGEPAVMVDNLEVAQFVYLLLTNEKIRDVLDTIGEKGVLILGRFTEERKAVLNAIRERLRERGFVPMMFDFERATHRDFTETIKTLAGLSRFVIADITNPRSSPLELQATMPDYMVPFVPIIHEDEEPFAMFRDLQQKYGEWVLDVLEYDSAANLQERLDKAVVRPALEKADQLILKKAEAIRTRHIRDYQ
jgi:uncharacterized protein YjbI with pentapeptide repeats